MNNIGLILPASAVAAPIIQIFVFILVLVIIPGSIAATLFRYVGSVDENGVRSLSFRSALFKFLNYTLYHVAMLSIWIITWPQFYNDIHTGYALSGLIPYLGIMVLWTLLGLYLIYIYRKVLEIETYRPTLGMFFRLFIWNLFIMFVFRQIIYYYVTR